MAKIELGYDLGEQERDGGNDLVPPGDYLVELQRVKYMEAKGNQNYDQLLLSIKVLDAADDDQKKYVGKSFLDGVSMSEGARWRMTQLLDSVYGRKVEGDELDTDDLIEKRLVVRTMDNEYNGKISTRVDRFLPLADWTGDADGGSKVVGKSKGKPIGGAPSTKDDDEVDL